MASRTSPVDSGSRPVVASSRMMIGVSRRRARAIAMRWRWPPDRVPPRSPTSASYPPGISMMKSWALAAFAAATISSSVAPSRPRRMFSRMVVAKSTASWWSRVTFERTAARVRSVSGYPPMRTRPLTGSWARTASDTSVDFPDPEGPMIATRSPSRTDRDRECRISTPSYSVTTRSNSRLPPMTAGCRAPGALTMSWQTSMRSATRSPEAPAREIRPVYLAMSRRGFMAVRR